MNNTTDLPNAPVSEPVRPSPEAIDRLMNNTTDLPNAPVSEPVRPSPEAIDRIMNGVTSRPSPEVIDRIMNNITDLLNTPVSEPVRPSPEAIDRIMGKSSKSIKKQSIARRIGNFFIPEAAAATNPSVYTDPRIEAPLSLIAMEESRGSYNAVNRGTKGNSIVGSDLNATRLGKPLTELTVGEVMDLQAIKDPDNPDRIFAFGKYQAIPDTFKQWVTSKNIPESTVMGEEAQEALGEWLLLEKRPNVKKILESDTTNEEKIKALRLEYAKEWASLPVPEGIPNKKAGESYYGSGNKAKIASAEVDAALAAWLGVEEENVEKPISPAIERLLKRTPKDLLNQEEWIRVLIDLVPEKEDAIRARLKGIY
jgi:transcriptional regulator with XRE-family HTH domain